VTTLINQFDTRAVLTNDVHQLLENLGHGVIGTVAYDTAWAARLEYRYPGAGFEDSLEWLRIHQHRDGSWGAPMLHYHDRYVSTLAATVALREAGRGAKDEERVRCGEAALWRMASYLSRDDSDTVGFPIISASLSQDATELGLDVPRLYARYAESYRKKVNLILAQNNRDWRTSVLSFSLEGLRRELNEGDVVLEANHSVASSPSATIAYLFDHYHAPSVDYLRSIKMPDGGIPAFAPLDVFDIGWSLAQLQNLDFVQPDHPEIQRVLAHLWERWSPETGSHYSSYFRVPDLDISAASFAALRWGGYPVDADAFCYFEAEDHFVTYLYETNPSAAAHLRLLMALQTCPEHPRQPAWVEKILAALRRFDANGSFWWDKWHTSPYYVSDLAVRALIHLDPSLAATRVKWMVKTQNTDGGWGYMGRSTVEETAYCINALLLWNRHVAKIDPELIDRGRGYMLRHQGSENYTPLWISKELYLPYNIVRSAVVSALYQTLE
jgi:halimadienyl-diphosphate synthase